MAAEGFEGFDVVTSVVLLSLGRRVPANVAVLVLPLMKDQMA